MQTEQTNPDLRAAETDPVQIRELLEGLLVENIELRLRMNRVTVTGDLINDLASSGLQAIVLALTGEQLIALQLEIARSNKPKTEKSGTADTEPNPIAGRSSIQPNRTHASQTNTLNRKSETRP